MNFISNIEAVVVRGETGSNSKKIKGELICEQCGATKILEVEVQDNHGRIYYYIPSFHGLAPKIWMNPRLDERCPSCQQCYMDPMPATSENKINWPFLYLIEALGYLSLDELQYYCNQNFLSCASWQESKERHLFLVFEDLSHKFAQWLSFCGGKKRKVYDSFDETEAITSKVVMTQPQGGWSYLPEELLELIFEWPTMDVADLQRCHGVCVSWRSVVTKLLLSKRECPPMLPPLLFFPNKKSCCKPSKFHTNATEFYRLGFPFSHCGRLFMYSSRGWLLSVGEDILSRDLQLLNPFSGVKIQLPDAPTGLSKPYKFILSNSSYNEGLVIVLLDSSKRKCSHCTLYFATTSSWSKIICLQEKFPSEDLIYFRKEFFGIDHDGNLFPSLEYSNLVFHYKMKNATSIGHPRKCPRYLVESRHGDLLMVLRHVLWEKESLNTSVYRTTSFEVYKLDLSKKWRKMTSLGDEALFLTHNDSRIVSASDPDVCKRNCIYFVDDSMEGYCKSRGTDFGVFDMKSKTIEKFCSVPFNRWFKPDI